MPEAAFQTKPDVAGNTAANEASAVPCMCAGIYAHGPNAYTHVWMYTCVCVDVHTCIHIYIHTYIHAYIHTYIPAYIHANMHTCIHTYIYLRTYLRTYRIMHACINTRRHVCRYACMYVGVHVLMCACMYRHKPYHVVALWNLRAPPRRMTSADAPMLGRSPALEMP